jgi:hypothetical protein
MGWVCLYVMPLLQHLQNHVSKGNKGNRPERQLAALAKQAIMTSVYTESTLKRNLHREFYSLLINSCLEKRCVIYIMRNKAPIVHL